MMPNPYFELITRGIFPVSVNVYTKGTVIVNTFTVTGIVPPVYIVNVYTNGCVNSNGCHLPLLSKFTLTRAFTLKGATELNPHATELLFLTPVLANKIQLFIHNSTFYIGLHPILHFRIGPRFSD